LLRAAEGLTRSAIAILSTNVTPVTTQPAPPVAPGAAAKRRMRRQRSKQRKQKPEEPDGKRLENENAQVPVEMLIDGSSAAGSNAGACGAAASAVVPPLATRFPIGTAVWFRRQGKVLKDAVTEFAHEEDDGDLMVRWYLPVMGRSGKQRSGRGCSERATEGLVAIKDIVSPT